MELVVLNLQDRDSIRSCLPSISTASRARQTFNTQKSSSSSGSQLQCLYPLGRGRLHQFFWPMSSTPLGLNHVTRGQGLQQRIPGEEKRLSLTSPDTSAWIRCSDKPAWDKPWLRQNKSILLPSEAPGGEDLPLPQRLEMPIGSCSLPIRPGIWTPGL